MQVFLEFLKNAVWATFSFFHHRLETNFVPRHEGGRVPWVRRPAAGPGARAQPAEEGAEHGGVAEMKSKSGGGAEIKQDLCNLHENKNTIQYTWSALLSGIWQIFFKGKTEVAWLTTSYQFAKFRKISRHEHDFLKKLLIRDAN